LSGLAEAERSITSIALKRLYVEWFEVLTYKFMIRKLRSKALQMFQNVLITKFFKRIAYGFALHEYL